MEVCRWTPGTVAHHYEMLLGWRTVHYWNAFKKNAGLACVASKVQTNLGHLWHQSLLAVGCFIPAQTCLCAGKQPVKQAGRSADWTAAQTVRGRERKRGTFCHGSPSSWPPQKILRLLVSRRGIQLIRAEPQVILVVQKKVNRDGWRQAGRQCKSLILPRRPNFQKFLNVAMQKNLAEWAFDSLSQI